MSKENKSDKEVKESKEVIKEDKSKGEKKLDTPAGEKVQDDIEPGIPSAELQRGNQGRIPDEHGTLATKYSEREQSEEVSAERVRQRQLDRGEVNFPATEAKQVRLDIPEPCYLRKSELEKIRSEIVKKGLKGKEAQEYLDKANEGHELITVEATALGYYDARRVRPGERFQVKSKLFSSNWMKVAEKKDNEYSDEDPMVGSSRMDGRSQLVI